MKLSTSCGRTAGHRTIGTHGSDVRCIKGYRIVVLTGTDAQTERPYKGLHVSQFDNGRTDDLCSSRTP